MLELLENMNYWHWLALGLGLLAFELLGTAGYFLWLGLSALIVGALLVILPMSWQLQWVCFGVFSLITTWIWWRKQFKKDSQDELTSDLNQKQKQMLGQTVILDEDFAIGKGRIKIADTTWTATSDSPIKAGVLVEVTEVNGIILTIKEKK